MEYIAKDIFNGEITKSTVARICKEVQEADFDIDKMLSERKPHRGKKAQLTEKDIVLLEDIQDEHSEYTLKQVSKTMLAFT